MQPATMPDARRYILVVDDTPAHAEAVRRALEAAGLDLPVQTGGTLREYHDLVAVYPPEVAIVDINLPDGTALEVLASPVDDGDFPVVVMTSFGSEQLAVEAMKAGALDYVVKSPEAFAAMPRTVERVLRQWNAIQERKRAEEALRESEERHRSLVATILDAVLLTTPEGEILSANAAACEMFGYAEEELLRVGRKAVVDATDPRLEAALEERVRTGSVHGEMTLVRSDGTKFPAEISSATFRVREGQSRNSMVIRDITARKKAEERERLARETLDLLGRSEGAEETIRAILAAVKDTTGFDAVAVRLRDGNDFPYYATRGFPEEFVLPERCLCARDEAGEILRDGEGNPVLECMCGDILCGRTNPALPFFTREGSFWANSTTELLGMTTEQDSQAPIRNRCNSYGYESMALIPLRAGAEIIGLLQLNDHRPNQLTPEMIHFFEGLGASIGIALARRRAAIESEKLQAQFLQAQKMESVGRLAGGVAHDFNNLLTVINGYSELLLRKVHVGDPIREGLEEIHRAGGRAAGLTQQLLAYSRRQVLQPRSITLDRVVNEMEPMLARLVGEDVQLGVELHAGAARIFADPHQLGQVVMNLAVNSRDAMPGGGQLSIHTAVVERSESDAQAHPEGHAGQYVMLSVSDTGEGMNEETRRKVFEPFFTTKGADKGTGLGLSMVHGIVHQSGGHIEIHSEPGRGTTFKIYLPLVEGLAADSEELDAIPVSAIGGKETVLVVEDTAEVRKFAAAALHAYGYRVIQAENAEEAMLLCERERERIDLVLTDVVMPHLSGRVLAERLEKLQPGIKVLFMSGYSDDITSHHGVLAEGVKLIQKPFTAEQLATKVREVLGSAEGKGPTILVVDDFAAIRSLMAETLSTAGYAVLEACDGVQARELLREHEVQLVLMDINMPTQGGLDAARQIRGQHPEIKIILMSAAFEGTPASNVAVPGADGVLPKPVEPEVLLDTVRRMLA